MQLQRGVVIVPGNPWVLRRSQLLGGALQQEGSKIGRMECLVQVPHRVMHPKAHSNGNQKKKPLGILGATHTLDKGMGFS